MADFALSDSKDTIVTIYSKSNPGAVNPNTYRPVPGQPVSYRYGSQVPGYAVVKEVRSIELGKKRGAVKISDVAAYIDPTTVMFSSLSYPDKTRVLEQNYLYDLVNREKLLQRFIDREIEIEQLIDDELVSFKATLLSTDGGLTLRKTDGSIFSTKNYYNIYFPDIPGGLIVKPTLAWDVETAKPGKHDVLIGYQTDGMTWWADYNLVFHDGKTENKGTIDLSSWVSIINRSGANYNDARLKLIAGDVQRVQPQTRYVKKAVAVEMMADGAAAPGFEEKSFFEYHLYTLGRTTTIPDNSTKQLELFSAKKGVDVKKELLFDASRNYRGGTAKIGVYLVFDNSEESGLGIPLPAGRVRVNKTDAADGGLEFIGEDIIDHTPKNEELRIKLGNAFDVVGERRVINSKRNNQEKWLEETIEIDINNHKENDVEVIVQEYLQGYMNWKIMSKSHKYERKAAQKIHFPIEIKADDTVTVSYKIRYSWK